MHGQPACFLGDRQCLQTAGVKYFHESEVQRPAPEAQPLSPPGRIADSEGENPLQASTQEAYGRDSSTLTDWRKFLIFLVTNLI